MASRRIAVTRSAEFQPLGAGGTLAVEHWDSLTAQIGADLSPAHAALFAEPQRNPQRGEIDWYAGGSGAAERADALPEAERAALLARWHAMRDEIAALAQRIAARPDSSSRFMAALIEAALHVPAPEARNLYRIDGAPVVVAWGHEPSGMAAARETLTGHVAAADVPMAILPPPPPPARPAAALWPAIAALLASLALLAAVLLVLWRDPYGWFAAPANACAADPEQLRALAELRDLSTREAVLRRELARVIAEAAQRRADCPPVQPPRPPEPPPRPQPPPPQPPPPQPPQRNSDLDRVQRDGGREGDLQIVLAWEGVSDLDLHVICPNGQRLFWGARQMCGGELDVDANADPRILRRTPVENARWGRPPQGTYRVEVGVYEPRGQAEVPYRLTIRQAGRPDRVITGVARGRNPSPVTTVQVP